MFKRVGFNYVQKENFQLVKTLGFYFVRFNIVRSILFTCSVVTSWDCILQRSTALSECVFCDSGDRSRITSRNQIWLYAVDSGNVWL